MEESSEIPNLYNSLLCRLCSVLNYCGQTLYSLENEAHDIVELIEQIIPAEIIKIENDHLFPNWICTACHLQVESTVQFFTLVRTGQTLLSGMLAEQHGLNTNATELPKSAALESQDCDKLIGRDHECQKKKRGRPPRKTAAELEAYYKIQDVFATTKKQQDLQRQKLIDSGRCRRQIKAPTRYNESLKGKELDRVFADKEKNVSDQSDLEDCIEDVMETEDGYPEIKKEIIGHVQSQAGANLGELMMINKTKTVQGEGFTSSRKLKLICDVCSRCYVNENKFLQHIRSHHNVRFECTYCQSQFLKRILLAEHQKSTGHSGEGIVESLGEIIDVKPEKGTRTDVESFEEKNDAENKNKDTSSIDLYSLVMLSQACEDKDCPPLDSETLPSLDDSQLANCDNTGENLHVPISNINTDLPSEKLVANATQAFPEICLASQLPQPSCDAANKDVYQCETCPRKFNNADSLLLHKSTEHEKQRIFACNKCDKTFKTKQLLQRHHAVHSQFRPFSCPICNESFKTKQIMISHQVIHSGVKNFPCNICSQTFSHKTSLTLHYRWHENKKPFSCDVCKKTFTQNGNLREHMRIHTGERPFSCKYCSKAFKTSSQNKLHMQRHTVFQNERSWKCQPCDKSFLMKGAYDCHMRRHSGEKPYTCTHCDRKFAEHWALVKHIRTHTGEKPYTCNVCNKSFNDCSNLARHKKIHLEHDAPTVLQKLAARPKSTSVPQATVTSGSTKNDLEPRLQTKGESLLLSKQHSNYISTQEQGTDSQLCYITYQMPTSSQSTIDEVDSIIVDESSLIASGNATEQIDGFNENELINDTTMNLLDTPNQEQLLNAYQIDTNNTTEYFDRISLQNLIEFPIGVSIGQDTNSTVDDGTVELITADGQKIKILNLLQEPFDQLDLGNDFFNTAAKK